MMQIMKNVVCFHIKIIYAHFVHKSENKENKFEIEWKMVTRKYEKSGFCIII